MNSNVTPFFLLILAIALFYVYINPGYAKIGTLRAQQAEYSDALDKVQQIQQIRDTLLTKYNSFSPDDLNKLETMLPDNVDNVHLVLDISNVAASYGLSIKNVKVNRDDTAGADNQNQTAPPYGKLTVAFTVTGGSYENFVKFLDTIEQSLRIIDITGVSFTTDQNGATAYNVTLNTYWLK